MGRFVPNVMLVLLAVASMCATAAITAAVLTRDMEQRGFEEPVADGELPVFFDVPEFALVDQDAQPFGSEQVRGKVWVADFMFTRCSAVCPMLSKNMQALQDELKTKPYWDGVRLVSISVDDTHDTPTILREYAERYHAEPGRWVFLTGEREQVWKLSEKGFKLPVGEEPENAAMPFSHTGKFAVVDKLGRIRAYHEGTDPASRAELIADIEKLLGEE